MLIDAREKINGKRDEPKQVRGEVFVTRVRTLAEEPIS